MCIPPGARLLLRDIPEHLQRQLGVEAVENGVFLQSSAVIGRHRDGLRFTNGQVILLQRLAEGQRVDVLALSSGAFSEEEADVEAEKSVILA